METRPHIIKLLGFNYTIKLFDIGAYDIDIGAYDIKLLQIDYLIKTPINIMASLNPNRYIFVFRRQQFQHLTVTFRIETIIGNLRNNVFRTLRGYLELPRWG